MKTYKGYQTEKFSGMSSLMIAYKYEAAKFNGIRFSHRFYFTYSTEENANCIINGRYAVEEKPSLNDNYYQANSATGVVLSTDMTDFCFQSNTIEHINYQPISKEDIQRLDFSENDDPKYV